MKKETIVASAFRVHRSKFSCSLAAALLDSLFEHPATILTSALTEDSIGILCMNRVFPQLARNHSLFASLRVPCSAMFRLNANPSDLRFPPVEQASPDGLLAVGGDLRPERLLEAYRHGIFPWYNDDQLILWWSPDPRTVLFPDKLHVSRSLKRSLRPGIFSVTLDTCFLDVMQHCAEPRPQYSDGGTWITAEMLEAYRRLHELGYAHSVETWQEGELVGGLYGVALGGAFFAESMFTRTSDASKVALVSLVRQLQAW